LTPRRLYEHREAVVAFHNAYVAYLEASVPGGPEVSADEAYRRRGDVTELIPAAQAALTIAGIDMTVYPPPAFGGPVLNGLANVAFAHEAPGFRRGEPAIPQQVMDVSRLAAAELESRAKALRRRRKNPLYWGDRILRAVLGFPAYLLSLILGVPVARIEDSPFGTLLRIFGLALQALAVYFAGHAAKWW
jgi:hypothetical protein